MRGQGQWESQARQQEYAKLRTRDDHPFVRRPDGEGTGSMRAATTAALWMRETSWRNASGRRADRRHGQHDAANRAGSRQAGRGVHQTQRGRTVRHPRLARRTPGRGGSQQHALPRQAAPGWVSAWTATSGDLARTAGRAPVFDAAARPFEHALQARAGSDAWAGQVQAALELHPDCTLVSLDGRSAYDTISRASFLTALRDVALELLPFVRLSDGQHLLLVGLKVACVKSSSCSTNSLSFF